MRTPEEIYEEIFETGRPKSGAYPVGPEVTDNDRLAYWEALAVVRQRLVELWAEMCQVLVGDRGRPEWVYMAVVEAHARAQEQLADAEQRAAEWRELLAKRTARLASQ